MTSTSPCIASRSSRRRPIRSRCSPPSGLPGRTGLGADRRATRIDHPARRRHVCRTGADSRRRDRPRARPIADRDRRPRESGRERRPRRPPRALHGARRRQPHRVAAEGRGGAGRARSGPARLHCRGPRRDRLRRLSRHLLLAHWRRGQGGRPRRRVTVDVLGHQLGLCGGDRTRHVAPDRELRLPRRSRRGAAHRNDRRHGARQPDRSALVGCARRRHRVDAGRRQLDQPHDARRRHRRRHARRGDGQRGCRRRQRLHHPARRFRDDGLRQSMGALPDRAARLGRRPVRYHGNAIVDSADPDHAVTIGP